MNNLLKVTRASNKRSEGITIRTAELSNHFRYEFNIGGDNRFIILTLTDGTRFVGKYSRNGETIYVPYKSIPKGFGRLPRVGKPVFIDVVEAEEL